MQYIAAIFELTAKWMVGNKNKWGFIVHLVGGAMWTYIAFTTPMYGLLIITIPAIVINIRNFIKWSRK